MEWAEKFINSLLTVAEIVDEIGKGVSDWEKTTKEIEEREGNKST